MVVWRFNFNKQQKVFLLFYRAFIGEKLKLICISSMSMSETFNFVSKACSVIGFCHSGLMFISRQKQN